MIIILCRCRNWRCEFFLSSLVYLYCSLFLSFMLLGFNCSETIFQETYQEIFSSIPSIRLHFNPFNSLKMIHVSSDHGINSPAQGNSGGEAVSVIDGHSPLEQI